MLTKTSLQQIDWAAKLKTLPWPTILAKAPFWSSVLLVVLIAHVAADMTWLIFSPSSASVNIRSSSTVSQRANTGASRMLSVANLHLFGEVDAAAPVVEAPIEAPKTSLRLTLKGVFSSEDPERALAIISDASGKEKLYQAGDNVPGGASVHTIYPDRVILNRNGRFETLNLPKESLPGGSVISSPAQNRTAPQKQRTVQAPEKLQEIRRMLKTEPQKLWQQVRITPVMKGGKISGYQLSHKDAQLMRTLGIKKTDVITEVNGYPLDDPAVLYNLMSQFDTATEIRLTIERNGGSEVLVVNM